MRFEDFYWTKRPSHYPDIELEYVAQSRLPGYEKTRYIFPIPKVDYANAERTLNGRPEAIEERLLMGCRLHLARLFNQELPDYQTLHEMGLSHSGRF